METVWLEMNTEQSSLNFCLLFKNEQHLVTLPKWETVEKLKEEIHGLYDILPKKQLIDGWKKTPNSTNDVLENCAHLDNITNLLIMEDNSISNYAPSSTQEEQENEIEATVSFISKIMNRFDNSRIHFHACKLQDAINEACMVSLEKRKALCLYLHNENDKFSSVLCENLKNAEVTDILNRNFFFLGYDVEEENYQCALIKALHECHDLTTLIPMVKSKISAAVCVVPIQDSVTIFSCIRGKVSNKDFLVALSNAENFLIVENQQERNLEELKEKTGSENDIGSINYQKLMADMLGDRDWDRFEHDQHEYLKKKIAFALLGPPQKEDGYEKKDMKKVQSLYDSILKSNNEISKHGGRVEISFLYNCTEPLPAEKMSRAKKYKEYNPNTDVMPLPIFVLRKCHGSPNPCRIFIDNSGRTYQTWQEYIVKNKFHQCEMILPLNGRYGVNENGEILLERHLSPACGVDSKLLLGADYLSTAGGIISGGIFVAAAIPTIAVAPAALIAGGVIGLGVGIYSMGRSAYTLYDRKKHKETLTFANSEARGAYLSIVSGSLGFVGVGATMVVSQLTSLGVNIGQGASAAVKTIGFVNLGATSASMLNSGYDVIDNWVKENRAASLLTIIQLKSSILFFGNVVHHGDVEDIDETQARMLQNYQESLRNNRLRKSVLVFQKKILRQYKEKISENDMTIISPIVGIPSKDQILAVITMNDDGGAESKELAFTINDNEIKLNNKKVDITEMININSRDIARFLSNKFPKSEASSENLKYVHEKSLTMLSNASSSDVENISNYATRILSCFADEIRLKLFNSLIFLSTKMTSSLEQALHGIFEREPKYLCLVDFIICFFGKKSEQLKDRWKRWISTRKEEFYLPFFEQLDEDDIEEMTFFEKAVDMSYQGLFLNNETEEELTDYFYNWLGRQVYDNQERLERNWRKQEKFSSRLIEKVPCSTCGGYFYKSFKTK